MAGYLTDLLIVAVMVIGITAVMGVLTNGIGKALFARGRRSEFVNQSAKFQTNWKMVGGKKK